jgi:hypothetical protein
MQFFITLLVTDGNCMWTPRMIKEDNIALPVNDLEFSEWEDFHCISLPLPCFSLLAMIL